MQISNNVILITGGTSGIGLEMVRKFYSLNNKLIVTSKNPTKLKELKNQFPEIEIIACDLGDNLSVQDLIKECLNKFKNINLIINNAGIQYNYSFMTEKYGHDKIEHEVRVNLISPMQITYGLLPLLLEKQNAAIINVSSGLVLAPKKTASIYCGTKAAIHNATKSIRYQLEHTSVRVFEIIPPLVDTPMTQGRGKSKMSTKKLVDEFIKNFEKDKFESYIGKTKLLRFINRISPKIAQSIMKNS